jgi:hypothetical protein
MRRTSICGVGLSAGRGRRGAGEPWPSGGGCLRGSRLLTIDQVAAGAACTGARVGGGARRTVRLTCRFGHGRVRWWQSALARLCSAQSAVCGCTWAWPCFGLSAWEKKLVVQNQTWNAMNINNDVDSVVIFSSTSILPCFYCPTRGHSHSFLFETTSPCALFLSPPLPPFRLLPPSLSLQLCTSQQLTRIGDLQHRQQHQPQQKIPRR